MKFKGYDWTEILEAFGFDTRKGDDKVCVPEMERRINLALHDCHHPEGPSEQTKEFLKAARAFARQIAKTANDGANPVYAGLAKVKHDITFLQLFLQLYQGMWV